MRTIKEQGGLPVNYAQAALAHLRAGDTARAEAAARKGIAADPGLWHPYLILSGILLKKGKISEALDCAWKACRANPADPEAALAVARAVTKKHPKLAKKAAAWVLAKHPGCFEARLLRAGLDYGAAAENVARAFDAGRYEEAFRAAEAVTCCGVPLESDYIRFFSSRVTEAGLSQEEGKRKCAELARARLAPGLEHWRRYYLGRVCEEVGNRGGGRVWKEKALEFYAGNRALPPARYGWMMQSSGRLRLRLDPVDFAGAQADFERVLRGNPKGWYMLCRLGELALCRGETKKAFALFASALRSSPEFKRDILTWRGQMQLLRGRYAQALADLDRAAALHAQYASGWRGAALLLAGRAAEAAAELEAALRESPGDAEARIWLLETYRALGDAAGMERELARVLRDTRENCWVFANLARSRFEAGDSKAGVKYFHMIDRRMLDFAARKIKAERFAGSEPRILKALFRLAKGFRRNETHLFPVWMKEPLPASPALKEKSR